MLKKIAAAALALVLFISLAGITFAAPTYPNAARQGGYSGQLSTEAVRPPTQPEPTPTPESGPSPAATPEPEPSGFYLNGELVCGMTLDSVEGTVYCSAGAFLTAALPEVQTAWDGKRFQADGVSAGGETFTFSARPGDCWLSVNGRCLYVEHEVQPEEDGAMVPLSVLTAVFPGSSFTWDEEKERTEVTLSGELLASGEEFYNAEDMDLIARVIYHEARYEPMIGKIALGNVITNRVAHSKFPNNVYDVLHARNQFTVVKRSVFWSETPNETCYNAAKLALEGTSILPTAVYYNVKGMRSWAALNRPLVGTIGNHSFFSE